MATDAEGRLIASEEWRERQRDWLPSAEDRAFVNSLMRRVTEPGKVAGWIAPLEIGINNTPRLRIRPAELIPVRLGLTA